jgi:hypothetical protein
MSGRRWMTTGMGPMFRVVQVGIGGTSGMVTDDSETFRPDNMESRVIGGACGKNNSRRRIVP